MQAFRTAEEELASLNDYADHLLTRFGLQRDPANPDAVPMPPSWPPRTLRDDAPEERSQEPPA